MQAGFDRVHTRKFPRHCNTVTLCQNNDVDILSTMSKKGNSQSSSGVGVSSFCSAATTMAMAIRLSSGFKAKLAVLLWLFGAIRNDRGVCLTLCRCAYRVLTYICSFAAIAILSGTLKDEAMRAAEKTV